METFVASVVTVYLLVYQKPQLGHRMVDYKDVQIVLLMCGPLITHLCVCSQNTPMACDFSHHQSALHRSEMSGRQNLEHLLDMEKAAGTPCAFTYSDCIW